MCVCVCERERESRREERRGFKVALLVNIRKVQFLERGEKIAATSAFASYKFLPD